MKIFLPAWHYRARAIVQKTWGWSPIEEMALVALDREPGTMADIAARISIPLQVARAIISRLMQFGLIELRTSPSPAFTTSAIGHNLLRSAQPLPERTSERELHISLVLEKVGLSVFRRKEVRLQPYQGRGLDRNVIAFPPGDLPETDETMIPRISQFVSLRPGEWLRGVKTTASVLERKLIEIDLREVKEGRVPEGSSAELVATLEQTLKSTVLPTLAPITERQSSSIETTFEAGQIVVGSQQHLERFEAIVRAATSDVFILSTFVAELDDEKGKERRECVYRLLEDACDRGVRVHLFFGTSLDKSKHAKAMQGLVDRLMAVPGRNAFVLAQRDSAGSHAKFLIADDGNGGAVAVVGSCNWLSSPFFALEVSVELREAIATSATIDLLRGIVVSLPTASRSVEVLGFMAKSLGRRRAARPTMPDTESSIPAKLTVLRSHEHERLLRKAAHAAGKRFVCITNKMGVSVVPGLLNPAEVAGRRLEDVRVFYSRRSKDVKRGHINAHRKRLDGIVEIIPVAEPQVHAKFLAWDEDHLVISSLNWGSQSGNEVQPLDEVGFYIEAPGVATLMLERFDEQLQAVVDLVP